MGIGMAHSLLNALPEIYDDVHETEMVVKKAKLADDEGVAIASGEEVVANFKSVPVQVEVLSTISIENPDHGSTTEDEDIIPDKRLSVKKEESLFNLPVAEGQPANPGADAKIATSHSMFMALEDEHDTPEAEKSTSLYTDTTQESKHVEDHLPSVTSPITTTPSSSPPSQTPSSATKTPLPRTPSSRRSPTCSGPVLMTLSSLLKHADSLYECYPPTHPGLALSTIMGPQSVVYTWREPELSSSAIVMGGNEWEEERLADDEAEAMVARPELVVYPYIEEDEDVDVSWASEEEANGWGWWSEKRTKVNRKQKGNGRARKETGKEREKRRPRRLRKNPLSRVEKRTMLAGAVLVLGIAMAVYGSRIGRGSSSGRDAHGSDWREWRRMGSWVGGVLVGVADRMVALSSGVKG